MRRTWRICLPPPEYLDCSPATCISALTGKLQLDAGQSLDVPRFFIFCRPGCFVSVGRGWFVVLFPDGSVGGQAVYSIQDAEKVVRTFDDRLYMAAVGSVPSGDSASQAPKQLFDSVEYDPAELGHYIASFPIQSAPKNHVDLLCTAQKIINVTTRCAAFSSMGN